MKNGPIPEDEKLIGPKLVGAPIMSGRPQPDSSHPRVPFFGKPMIYLTVLKCTEYPKRLPARLLVVQQGTHHTIDRGQIEHKHKIYRQT